MGCNHNFHNRKSIRLPGYDYSQSGAYFVTICVQNQQCLFGEIVDGVMLLNEMGKIVVDEWVKTAVIRREISLGDWVVMPNHFHGIVVIDNHRNRGHCHTLPQRQSPSKNLGAMIRGFKSAATKQINQYRQTPGTPVWQRNYWEHIIRNDDDLHRIREYMQTNPMRWQQDSLHPNAQP